MPRGKPRSSRVRRLRAAQTTFSGGWSLPVICILTYLFVIHSEKLNIGSAAIILGFVGLLLEGRRIQVPRFLVALGVFLLWALITAPLALSPTVAFDSWTNYAKFWLISLLLFNAVHTHAHWRIVTVGWLALFALFPLRGIVFNVLTGTSVQGRYAWNFLFTNPNDYAAIAVLVLTLTLVILRTEKTRWLRLCALTGATALPAAILLTGSRGGFLGVALLSAILIAFSRNRLTIIGVGVAASLVALPLLPDSTKERLKGIRFLTSSETIDQADMYGSAAQRRVILSVATAVTLDHLVTGVGIGNYPLANARYAMTRPEWRTASGFRDSHNAYMTIVAETGLLGLMLFLSSIAVVARDVWRSRTRQPINTASSLAKTEGIAPTILFGGLAAFTLMSLTGSFFYSAFPYLFCTLSILYCNGQRAGRLGPGTLAAR